jgi:hypothetical protein
MIRGPAGSALALVGLLLVTGGCRSTGLTAVTYPDPSVACPGGLAGWNLDVLDRRARRDQSEGVQALVTESIHRSFPGCRWESAPGAGRIQIEIHRFSAVQDGNSWEAAANWSVVASDSSGRTLTEFETNEEVSRPNYRGSNNEKEALREAFDRAIRRTLAGLRAVTLMASFRLPGRTLPPGPPDGRADGPRLSSSTNRASGDRAG